MRAAAGRDGSGFDRAEIADSAAAVSPRVAVEELAPDTALRHADAYQLLVATILSAQCTDARVNLVTPELFRRFPDSAKTVIRTRGTGMPEKRAASLFEPIVKR